MANPSSPARGPILIIPPGKNGLIRSRPLPAFPAPPLRFLSSPRQQGAFCHFAGSLPPATAIRRPSIRTTPYEIELTGKRMMFMVGGCVGLKVTEYAPFLEVRTSLLRCTLSRIRSWKDNFLD